MLPFLFSAPAKQLLKDAQKNIQRSPSAPNKADQEQDHEQRDKNYPQQNMHDGAPHFQNQRGVIMAQTSDKTCRSNLKRT